jgi:hypothetical protein
MAQANHSFATETSRVLTAFQTSIQAVMELVLALRSDESFDSIAPAATSRPWLPRANIAGAPSGLAARGTKNESDPITKRSWYLRSNASHFGSIPD